MTHLTLSNHKRKLF